MNKAELWRLRPRAVGPFDVSVPDDAIRKRPGIWIHQRTHLRRRYVHLIPVGDPISVLVDLATCLPDDEVEDAVNEADRLDLIRNPQRAEWEPWLAFEGLVTQMTVAPELPGALENTL